MLQIYFGGIQMNDDF